MPVNALDIDTENTNATGIENISEENKNSEISSETTVNTVGHSLIQDNVSSLSNETQSLNNDNLISTENEENSLPIEEEKTTPDVISLQSDETEDGEEPSTDNWELGLVFYDSSVDNGKTPLTEINWDASDGGYEEGTPRVITVQINYKNTNAVTTYAPGELEINIPNLIYNTTSNTDNSPLWKSTVVIGANDSTHSGYDWDFSTSNTNQEIYRFTNAETIEEKSNFEGSIQIVYTITPNTENPEIEQSECTHVFSRDLQAILKNITQTERISLIYTRTYIHPWRKSSYSMKEYPQKISSYDGLGENAEDYIWVIYDYIDTTETNNFYRYKYPWINVQRESGEYRNVFPEGCIVYDNAGNLLTPTEDGTYIFDKTLSRGPSYNYMAFGRSSIRVFVGYPKTIYNEENNNLIIDNPVELWGAYGNNTEKEYLNNDTIRINLSEFMFEYPPGLYGIEKDVLRNSALNALYYKNIQAQTENNNWIKWELSTSAFYRGKPLTVKTGDDLHFITDHNGENIRMKDDEYYFMNIYIGALYNMNNVKIPANKYDCELWVRYKNTDEYVLYTTFKNFDRQRGWSFTKEQGVVGWYVVVKDVNESITHDDLAYVKYLKTDIPKQGEIHNFSYIEAYHKDSEGNLIKQNPVTEDNYTNLTTKENIAQYDIETYGYYQQRDYHTVTWSDYKQSQPSGSLSAYKVFDKNVTQNAKDEKFYGNFNMGFRIDPSVNIPNWNPEDLELYWEDYNPEYALRNFEMYDLLPQGMDIVSDGSNLSLEDQIKNSLIMRTIDGNRVFLYDLERNELSYNDVVKIVKENAQITITKNYHNTGRTMIKISSDFSDTPFYAWEAGNSSHAALMANIKYSISYDAILEKGNVWTNNDYLCITPDSKWRLSSTIKDNGEKDKDVSDINNNGDIEETLSFAKDSVTITSVISTHQDVTKYVKTDKSDYSTGTVKATPGSIYTYKLRARTGAADVTNLVIYDSIEKYAKDKNGNMVHAYGEKEHWNGEFLGIDTSYARSKGYKVKTYYSEKEIPGTLEEDDSWKEYFMETHENGMAVTFNDSSNFYSSSAYMEIYYQKNEKTYKLGTYRNKELSNKTINIPSNDFYIYLYTGSYNYNAYGFSIDKITNINIAEEQKHEEATLPNIEVIEKKDFNYPESDHPYAAYQKMLWHYTGDPFEEHEGSDNSKVKSLAFEYLNKDGSKAVIPANSLTYVLINMKAPEEDNIKTMAYNGCWTEWNALDDYDRPVDFITGINSNIVRTTLNEYFDLTVNKIWDDENNKYELRPDSIDIILKKDDIEVDRKQITKDVQSVTFSRLLSEDAGRYSIEESSHFAYESSIIGTDDGYDITNTLKEELFTEIAGTKIWLEDEPKDRPESITIKLLKDGKVYRTTTTNAEKDWKYIFPKVPIYNADETKCIYSVEEIPIEKYTTQYTNGNGTDNRNGLAIKFNSQCRTESANYDYVEIYYKQDGQTFKLGKWGGTALAGKTVNVPTKDFYLYWRTDSSQCSYYGFSIDSIESAEVSATGTVATLPNYTATELTGTDYPESPNHGNYGNNVKMLWHYTGNFTSDVPAEGLFNIINTYEGEDAVGLSFVKAIEGTDEAFEKLQLEKDALYRFQVSMKNRETNDIISVSIDNKNVATVSEVPIGTYIITEKDDMYFDFVSMEALNSVEGITFEKVGNDYVLTITKDASEEGTLQIKVNNKIETDRPYEDKEEKENLFQIHKKDRPETSETTNTSETSSTSGSTYTSSSSSWSTTGSYTSGTGSGSYTTGSGTYDTGRGTYISGTWTVVYDRQGEIFSPEVPHN